MGKVAVITGTGMDSRTLCYFLLSKSYTVILTHRRNTLLDLSKILDLFKFDLMKYPQSRLDSCFMEGTDSISVNTSIQEILKKHGKIDELYLLHAQSQVGDSFNCEQYSILLNGMSPYYFLDSLRKHSKTTRIYFANTSECFGGDPAKCPFNEESRQELRSPYSIGKNLGANVIKYFRQTHDMYACYGWLFNHSNQLRGDAFFFMKVIRAAVKIALGTQSELVLGNLHFWRDEHLSDFGVEMMWKMLNNPKGPVDYVVGNGNANHAEEYLDAAFSIYNLDWHKYVKQDTQLFRPNEVVKLVADPSKAVQDLGWKPNRITLAQHIGLVSDYVFQEESGKTPIRVNPFNKFPN